MARPRKEGLEYFPLDVDFFSNRKIRIVKARYGADGITIYLYLLCEIYKKGYYIIVDEDFFYIVADDLNMSQDKVKQVINFLLERSLFDNTLFQSDKVLTSAGIQRQFQEAVKSRASKNPIEIKRFWILEKSETETFIKVHPADNNSENKEDYSRKNDFNSEKNDIKENKEKENKEKKSKKALGCFFTNQELEDTFHLFIQYMENSSGKKMDMVSAQLFAEELRSLSKKETEQIAILKKTMMKGWKGLYPLKKESKKNSFNNIDSRTSVTDELERSLLG